MLQSIKKWYSGRGGFTFVEVLVVITIIGLLSSVVIVGLGGFRARGRDARRLADLKSIQNALELYYSKFNQYPSTFPDDVLNAGIGVSKLPKDPSNNSEYFYSFLSSNHQGYVVSAKLDAVAGDAAFNDSDANVTISNYTGSVTSCGAPFYCVVSL